MEHDAFGEERGDLLPTPAGVTSLPGRQKEPSGERKSFRESCRAAGEFVATPDTFSANERFLETEEKRQARKLNDEQAEDKAWKGEKK